jgi:cobalt-zinc-cadmium efflux system membrane fusion protein
MMSASRLSSLIRQRPFFAVICAVAVTALAAALTVCAILPPGDHGPGARGDAHPEHAHASAPDTRLRTHGEPAPGVIPLGADRIEQAGITLAEAGPASIMSSIELPGEIRLDADRTAHVVPRVAGVVEQVNADLGADVRKGQVLAVLASTVLAEQRSELLAAQKRLELARVTHERERALWQQKVSPELDYLQARQALTEAEIALASVRGKLSALGAQAVAEGGALNRYVLRAPFDGQVIEKHLSVGEAVREDSQVFIVSDLATVWVDVSVPARELERVRAGSGVSVRSVSSGRVAHGKVAHVGALLGEQTRSALARVVLANPDRAWRPGLFVSALFEVGRSEVALAVDESAVHKVDGKDVVFVRTAEGFVARPVLSGLRGDGQVEIRSGLAAGERYARGNSFVLKAELGKAAAEHVH